VSAEIVHAADLLSAAGAKVVRLFAPEHGAGGGHQDMVAIDERIDPLTGLPVVSLYGENEDSLSPDPAQLADLDLLVADLADVGARYYTFSATIVRVLRVAAQSGLRVIVADRPNPIGGEIEGCLIEEGFHSFVGEISVPQRHGLTIGELARLAREREGLDVELEVVPARGWTRDLYWDDTGLPWVLPSPNMPTLDTAIVYPGGCLFEGTNLSEGRGTTRPFELVGAPFLDGGQFARHLNRLALPGVAFRATSFVPGFQKHAGQVCGGVQLHVLDRAAFRPLLTGLAVIECARRLAPDAFDWRRETYEFVSDPIAIDLLAGSSAWRESLESGTSAREIAASWAKPEMHFREELRESLLYPPGEGGKR
jgi:uncharacterized protein YbbC (DUF1343 family)